MGTAHGCSLSRLVTGFFCVCPAFSCSASALFLCTSSSFANSLSASASIRPVLEHQLRPKPLWLPLIAAASASSMGSFCICPAFSFSASAFFL